VAGQRIAVQVAGGQVSGDTGRVPVPVGDQVTLTVTSDVADEVHVHGYDLTAALTPGAPAELTFDATIPGVFEVELHEAGTVLLSLQVG
jgi:heme/copper-type cytochrome/quinol oxidase subunit 2